MRKAVPRSVVQVAAAIFFGVAVMTVVPRATAIAETEGRSVVRSVVPRDGTIKVEAYGASVLDIIENLSRTLGFEVLGDPPSKELRITRSLDGTLSELLARLLHDANYVLVTEAGAAKRLIILPAGSVVVAQPDRSQLSQSMSVEQLRQKESELIALSAQYEDMSEEARERANPEFARKLKTYAKNFLSEAETIRARLPR